MNSYSIAPPLVFSEVGQRKNNEDYYLPRSLSRHDRLFVVCDGMGGLDRGEEASRIVAEMVYNFLAADAREISEGRMNEAVALAHRRLKAYMDENPLLSRMGSTLTLLCLGENAAVVAHIGDSRVYHIRAGEMLYRTRDHKQVEDMLEDGLITKEQALTHPWRNRLSRSVSVECISEDHAEPLYDVPHCQWIRGIKPGDYFFLCTDGVLEQVTDTFLLKVLSEEAVSNEQKMKTLKEKCEGGSKDNYTALLVQIDPERL